MSRSGARCSPRTSCAHGGDHDGALALNDVVVNRGSSAASIECAVEIDGRFAYAMRADGIIVATPTGSPRMPCPRRPHPRAAACVDPAVPWRRTQLTHRRS